MAVETTEKAVTPKSQNATAEEKSTQDASSTDLFVSSAEAPEPMSSEDEDDEDDALVTSPNSEAKGPVASKKAPVKNPAAKSSLASKLATPVKQPPNRAKQFVGAVKATKKEQQVHAKGGKKPEAVKGDDGNTTNQTDKAIQTAQSQASKGPAITKLEVKSGITMDPAVFSTRIFDIFIGPNKTHYMAHEAILVQSPLLTRLIQTQSTKKGKLKQTLVIPRESSANFGTLLEYLYSHQLVMPSLSGDGVLNGDMEGEDAKVAAKMLAKLYVLADNYEMEGMQERITHVLEETDLMGKIPGLEFFELAEKLYPADADDAEEDEFARHFNKVAPELIRTVPDKDLPELMRMVSAGGPYAEAIFLAYNTAVKSGIGFDAGMGVRIKREHVDDEGDEDNESTKRARTAGSGDGDAI